MAKSLRDQLIKSGATNADSGSKRGKKRKQPKAAKKDRAAGRMTADSNEPSAADIRVREQTERDRELNRQRQQKLEAREVAAQIRQLIERNQIAANDNKAHRRNDDNVANSTESIDQDDAAKLDYNFTDNNVVRRLSLSANVHRRVVVGTIAIARLDDQYYLIPRPVADKICQRDGSSIVVLNEDGGESNSIEAADDEYAQFEVPDDLMW